MGGGGGRESLAIVLGIDYSLLRNIGRSIRNDVTKPNSTVPPRYSNLEVQNGTGYWSFLVFMTFPYKVTRNIRYGTWYLIYSALVVYGTGRELTSFVKQVQV